MGSITAERALGSGRADRASARAQASQQERGARARDGRPGLERFVDTVLGATAAEV